MYKCKKMIRFNVKEIEETDVLDEVVDVIGNHAHLLVYNDDFNTFDWVIRCLIEILNHTSEQAEQLSLIVHFKGKATVKSGPKSVLKPLKDALVDRGLSAVIEEESGED
jgi:ATP-dependent Clp protease adaptor protein ClpS